MSESYRSLPQRDLEFRAVMTRPLVAFVREVTIVVGDDAIEISTELEVSGDVYARCLDEGHFGLDLPGRGDGPEPQLDQPVRITARLRQYLTDQMLKAEDPMQATLDAMAAGDLASTDAWRATDIVQPVGGGVSMGYRTAWK